jgi:hypothetical protein
VLVHPLKCRYMLQGSFGADYFFPLCQDVAVLECWHHDLTVKLLCYVGNIIIIYRHVIHVLLCWHICRHVIYVSVVFETTLQFALDNYFVVLIFEFLLSLVTFCMKIGFTVFFIFRQEIFYILFFMNEFV